MRTLVDRRQRPRRRKTKQTLHLYTIPKFQRKKVSEARLATQYLHEISQHLLSLIRHMNNRKTLQKTPPDTPEEDFSLHRPLDIHFPLSLTDTKWDPKWLQLVGAYFAHLRWPLENWAPSEVSCIELMPDLINTPFLLQVGGSSSIIWDKNNSQCYLLSREEAMTLPEPLLTELSHTWLLTLEYLGTRVKLTPVPRTSSRSLRHFA